MRLVTWSVQRLNNEKRSVHIYYKKDSNSVQNYMPQICWLTVNRKYPTISEKIHSGMIPLSKIFFLKEAIFDKSKTW